MKNKKIRLIILMIIIMILTQFTKVNAHSVDLDPKSLITMPSLIYNGSGKINISSTVTDYKLYFQAVKMEISAYEEINTSKTAGEEKIKTIENEYKALKPGMDNAEEAYNQAYTAYSNGLKNAELSKDELEKLKTNYEEAKTNYEAKVKEYNEKIDEYNNVVNEVNTKIKELTPMYDESNWTETADNNISVDTTKFSGKEPYVIWAKLVTGSETYYDECIYTMEGSKAVEIDVTGISLDKTTLSLTEGSSYTLTATITPTDATNKNVIWESDNESVATVNDGKVTSKSVGTAKITATTKDGNFKAICTVTVTENTVNKDNNQQNNNSQIIKTEDNTTINSKLPRAGISEIAVGVILVLAIVGIVFYKKYKYLDI